MPTVGLGVPITASQLIYKQSVQKCYKDTCDLTFSELNPSKLKNVATLGETLDSISSNKVYALNKEHG